MASLNKVMLLGRLTKNPDEPRMLANTGTMVVKFRLAVGRSRKNQQTGEWENDPNVLYIDCEAFSKPDAKRNLVEVVTKYVKQGDQILIEGRLQLDEWTDKTSGQQRSKHKVVVDSVELLGGRAGGGDDGGNSGGGGGNYPPRGGGGHMNRGAQQSRQDQSPADDDGGGADTDADIPF